MPKVVIYVQLKVFVKLANQDFMKKFLMVHKLENVLHVNHLVIIAKIQHQIVKIVLQDII